MYDTGEYDIVLDIPTDNYVVLNLYPSHLESIVEYVKSVQLPNENTLIILLGAFQCIQEHALWVDPLNDFCKTIPNPVIVFTGKLNKDANDSIPSLTFAYCRISMFDYVSNFHWNRRVDNQLRNWTFDCMRERKYKFYWASSKDWYTRRYILAGLINSNLISDNLVNYKCLNTDIPGPWLQQNVLSQHFEHVNQECTSIQHMLPLASLDNTVEFSQTNVNFYLDSIMGIVTDTFFNQGVFVSEKVFNAINYQQLFFYIGYKGTLQYLRDQGYNTFDDIIDTSYDTIEDTGSRLIAARKSLLEFLEQPLSKLQLAYKKSIPAIKHNKNLLQKQRPDIQFSEYIRDYLNEH